MQEASLEQGDKSVEEHDDSDFERTLEQLDNTSPRKKVLFVSFKLTQLDSP